MRVNCTQALRAWRKGKALRPAQSIWTDGETIFSYGTALVTKRADGTVVLNRTRYSVTTTIHQNTLAFELAGAVEVDNLSQGVDAYNLRFAADYAQGEVSA